MGISIKQSIGIDISKLSFSACLCKQDQQGFFSFSNVESFANDKTGFNQFLKWIRKTANKDISHTFVMEATGIYYESLAYYLHRLNKKVCVLLPTKVKYYAKSLNVKTKTDKIDAKIIARMGAEHQHPLWIPPSPILKELRNMTRFYLDLKKEAVHLSNHLEAIQNAEQPSSYVIRTYKKLHGNIVLEIKKCEESIRCLISKDSMLSDKVTKLETIKGVGFITIAIIIAETQGFTSIRSRKQLASYAGFDIIERQSGTSINGKTRISKKGNRRIRAALYFPAMACTRYNETLKEDYNRINQGKECKKIGITALQRKLLLLIYTLWKNNDTFRDKDPTSVVPLRHLSLDKIGS